MRRTVVRSSPDHGTVVPDPIGGVFAARPTDPRQIAKTLEEAMVGIPGGPACQSCGAPMTTARDHGGGRESNPYCRFCSDGAGNLLPYERVHQNMVEERFIKVNKMPRPGAEQAAHKALSHMPAWKGRHP